MRGSTPLSPGARDERDRYVDLIRGLSIVMVVAGHWLISQIGWNGRSLTLASSLGAAPQLWPITWALQVIPLFFFVGGFSNRRSWEGVARRGEGYAAFVERRVRRVLGPTVVFLSVAVAGSVVSAAVGGAGLGGAGGILTQPLWFLGVYVLVVSLTPATLAWHRRWRWRAPALLALVAAAVDGVRLGLGLEWVGLVNVLVVWTLMHQLGYLYAESALTPARGAALAAGGLALLCALVGLGPYPARMVGVPGDPLANMNPPTVAIAALGVWQIGLAVLVRRRVVPFLTRRRVHAAVVAVNLSIMTLYLWHQAALAVVARIGLPLGLPQPAPASGAWWLTRPLWLGLPGLALALVVLALRGLEQVRPVAAARSTPTSTVAAGSAVGLLFLGLLGVAGTDVTRPLETRLVLGAFDVSPLMALACVAVAACLVRAARAGEVPARLAMAAGVVAFGLLAWAHAAGLGPLAPVPGAVSLEVVFAGLLATAGASAVVAGRGRRETLRPANPGPTSLPSRRPAA